VTDSAVKPLMSSQGVGYVYRSWLALLPLAAWALSLTLAPPAHAFPGLTDGLNHPPPTTGLHAYETFTPAAPHFPGLGESYIDPVFGAEVRRLTDIYPGTGSTGSGIIYGVNGLWNADGTAYLSDSPWGVDVIDPATGTTIRANVPYPYTTTDAVSFDPVNPDIYYYTSGTRLRQYNIRTGTTSTVKTFSQTLGGLGQSADWIDRTGRWFALNIGGKIQVWDRQRNVIYSGSAPIGGIPPGWAGISPDGNYLILSLNPQHYSYKLDHTNKRLGSGVMFWSACYDHGDVMTASNGKTYFITDACLAERAIYRVDVTLPQSPSNLTKQLRDNVRLFTRGPNSGGHFACAAYGTNRDWCVATTEDPTDQIGNAGTWWPYRQEIVLVHMLSPFEAYRLVHHRARPVTDYCRSPRVNANWDGTLIAFASNMSAPGNGQECGYSDLYVIGVGAEP
jgi:hypothetical protein